MYPKWKKNYLFWKQTFSLFRYPFYPRFQYSFYPSFWYPFPLISDTLLKGLLPPFPSQVPFYPRFRYPFYPHFKYPFFSVSDCIFIPVSDSPFTPLPIPFLPPSPGPRFCSRPLWGRFYPRPRFRHTLMYGTQRQNITQQWLATSSLGAPELLLVVVHVLLSDTYEFHPGRHREQECWQYIMLISFQLTVSVTQAHWGAEWMELEFHSPPDTDEGKGGP